MNLQISDWFSLFALVVSIVSLAGSLYAIQLDRFKLKATSTLYLPDEYNDKAHIEVRIVNHGRRVAVLTMFGGDSEAGGWYGSHLFNKGLYLAENEIHKRTLTKDEAECVGPEWVNEYVSLWFEDSHGRRHQVKGSRKHLEQLKKT